MKMSHKLLIALLAVSAVGNSAFSMETRHKKAKKAAEKEKETNDAFSTLCAAYHSSDEEDSQDGEEQVAAEGVEKADLIQQIQAFGSASSLLVFKNVPELREILAAKRLLAEVDALHKELYDGEGFAPADEGQASATFLGGLLNELREERKRRDMIHEIHQVLIQLGAPHAVAQLRFERMTNTELAAMVVRAKADLAVFQEYTQLKKAEDDAKAEVARLKDLFQSGCRVHEKHVGRRVIAKFKANAERSMAAKKKAEAERQSIAQKATAAAVRENLENSNSSVTQAKKSALTRAYERLAQVKQAVADFARRHPWLTAAVVTLATFPVAAATGSVLFPDAVELLASAAAQWAILVGLCARLGIHITELPGAPVIDEDADMKNADQHDGQPDEHEDAV